MKLDEEPRGRSESQAHLKVALLQIVSEGAAIEANARKGEEFYRRAADLDAHIALFPEMWSAGYAKYPSGDDRARAEWLKLAVPRDGLFVDRFRRLARELRNRDRNHVSRDRAHVAAQRANPGRLGRRRYFHLCEGAYLRMGRAGRIMRPR